MKLPDIFSIVFLVIQFVFFLVYVAAGRSDDSAAGIAIVFTYSYVRDISMLTLLGFGLSASVLRKYGFSGLAITFAILVLSIQWGMITATFFQQAYFEALDTREFVVDGALLIEGNYAAMTVVISFGALLGLVSPAQMLIVAMIEVLFYSFNWYLCLLEMQALDTARSVTVHLFGATFGLVVGILLPKDGKKHAKEMQSPFSDYMSLIGTVFIWLLYPSFMVGGVVNSAVFGAGASPVGRIVVNGYMALLASALTTFLLSRLLIQEGSRKFDIQHILTCTVVGGIAVGTFADRAIGPGGAILMGILGATLSVIFSRFATPKLQGLSFWHDTRGVFHGHFLPALLSGLGSILITIFVEADVLNNDEGVTLPRDERQPGYQVGLIIVTLLAAIFSGVITGLILRFSPKITFLYGDAIEPYDDSELWTHADGTAPPSNSDTPMQPMEEVKPEV